MEYQQHIEIMKELSIEQKARAYDEALEIAKECLQDGTITTIARAYIWEIFPELKGLKDEQIRKELIEHIKANKEADYVLFKKFSTDDVIAWLEKQGEQQGKSALEAWKDMRLEVYQQASGNRHEPNYSDDTTKMFSLNDIEEIIDKISEQSHNDNVEPKFHEGEWVVLTAGELSTTLQIVKVDINKKLYWFDDSSYLPIVDEECLHLWTINDAKDGDVLWHSDSASNGIFILKEIRHDGKVLCYCDYDSEDHFCTGEYHTCCWSNDKYIKPATKEQRDTLFAKMKEAGYEWDAENKCLTKK